MEEETTFELQELIDHEGDDRTDASWSDGESFENKASGNFQKPICEHYLRFICWKQVRTSKDVVHNIRGQISQNSGYSLSIFLLRTSGDISHHSHCNEHCHHLLPHSN